MSRPILIDGRNMYSPEELRAIGFKYRGVGRGYNGEGTHGNGDAAAVKPD